MTSTATSAYVPRGAARERPLSPAARAALVAAACVTILLFYVAAVASMAILGVIIVALAIVILGGARFGLFNVLTPLIAPPSALFLIIARRLWLREDTAWQITLEPNEAPRLFEAARGMAAKLGVAQPDTVVVEGHHGAWVRLAGFGRGSGGSTLCVGYDLLAGLSRGEVEAVIAHELGHARFVQRGLSKWLNKGLARLSSVSHGVWDYSAQCQMNGRPSDLANWHRVAFDALTTRAARLVATYSRQDEFEADRAAAELRGAAALRSALLKLESLDQVVGRLPWGERVARLHSSENFAGWLESELKALTDKIEEDRLEHAPDPYSTHPSTRDRIEALPVDDRAVDETGSAMALLADPNRVARRLVDRIHEVGLQQERLDTKRLRRETRRLCRNDETTLSQLAGVVIVVTGAAFAVIFPVSGAPIYATAAALAVAALGIVLYRRPRRDRFQMPVPEFGTLSTRHPHKTTEELKTAEDAIIAEIDAAAEAIRSKRERAKYLTSLSYQELAKPDYVRAHVAARLALAIRRESIEANLAYAVAASGLEKFEQVNAALTTVKRIAGFKTVSTKWGAAWALVDLDPRASEGLLQELHEREPEVATYVALLSYVQREIGKVQSAISNGETALALAPQNVSLRGMMAALLLEVGRVDDAARTAVPLEAEAHTDPRAAALMSHIHLMRRDTDAAIEWARVAASHDETGMWRLKLGQLFLMARHDRIASDWFASALETEYAPAARVGLSVLANPNKEEAKLHLLRALDLQGKQLPKPLNLEAFVNDVCARLYSIDRGRETCRAWIGTVPADSGAHTAGLSLLVYAPTEAATREYMLEVVQAMEGNGSTLAPSDFRCEAAPKDQQPVRPVLPGVQGITAWNRPQAVHRGSDVRMR